MIHQDTLDQAGLLLERLKAAGVSIATAESCTGGLVAAALTHHPGSSAVVLGGFVTYSNEMKHRVLGVGTGLLDRFGAVSGEVAAAMAEGALARSGAGLAVSVTGIAGPGGATVAKPVGLVWFGLAQASHPTRIERLVLPGNRGEVREASVRHALALLDGALPGG